MIGRRRFPSHIQLDQMDCGPTCVKIVAEHFGYTISREYLRKRTRTDKRGTSFTGLQTALSHYGIDSLAIAADMEELMEELPLPLIAHWSGNHFVVVHGVRKNKVFVSDPALGLVTYGPKEFGLHWAPQGKGVVLLLEKTKQVPQTDITGSKKSFSFLWTYLEPFRDSLLPWVLALVLLFCIQLALPFLTQAIVDGGIMHQDLTLVQLIMLGYGSLVVVRLLSEALRDGWILWLTAHVKVKLLSNYLERLLKASMEFLDTKTTGDVLQRIYDHHHVDAFLGNRSLAVVFDIFSLLAFGAVLFLLERGVGVLFVSGMALFLIWTLAFLRPKEVLDHRRFANERKGHSLLVQLIVSIRDIQLNGSHLRRIMEWKGNQHGWFQLERQLLKLDLAQGKGGNLIWEAMGLFILFRTAQHVLEGDMTLGSLLAIQFIMGSLYGPSIHIIDFLVDWQRARLALERLGEVLTGTDNGTMALVKATNGGATIKGDDINFYYGGASQQKVLDGVSFEIPFGNTVALVGPSGCGKSSLLKLLLKLYEPRNGKLSVGGQPLRLWSSESWREECGAVLQDSRLFNDTLERNITESRPDIIVDEKALWQAIADSELTDLVHGLPLGLATHIGEDGQFLSGGQRQRVLLARALYRRPSYLFLDEATSALDSATEAHIIGRLLYPTTPRTTVIASHRLSTIRNADSIWVMETGQIVEKGNHMELIKKQGAYHRLVREQL